jgi:predicted Ser/Thr protein kinase
MPEPDLVDRARKLAAWLADLPTDERERELLRTCATDDELARAVRGRLRAHDLAHELVTLTASPDRTIPSFTAAHEPPPRIGRFHVIRELGRGGMGIVYEAEQELPRRRVALKTLSRGHSAQAVAQFAIEIDATARVLHPGIPQVYEVFEADGAPVLVMEFIEGLELDKAVQGFDREQRVRVLRDIALAVHAVHERGVIHRDLKPRNVLLTLSGQVKVLDFGVAALAGECDGRRGYTLGYAAPEQLAGGVEDRRCDVYGLGAIGLEILTGRLVADPSGLSLTDLVQRKSVPLEPPLELPSALAAILIQALAPLSDDRYPTARALAEDLDRYLRWRPVQAFERDAAAVPDRRVELRVESGPRIIQRELDGGEQTGALRVVELAAHPSFVDDRWFGVELAPELVGRARAIVELELSPDARGTVAATALFGRALELGLRDGALLTFCVATPERYPELVRLGFRVTGRVMFVAELGHVVPMVLVNHDLAHLAAIGSPLDAVLRTHGRFGDERGREWLQARLAHASAAAEDALGLAELDTALCEGLSAQGKAELIDNCTRRVGAVGSTLLAAGDPGSWMAIVDAGLVEIVVDDLVIAVRGPGELIGEMSFLLGKPRTARVVVAAPGTALTILSNEAVARLSQPGDREQVWRNLAVILARKLEAQTRDASRLGRPLRRR